MDGAGPRDDLPSVRNPDGGLPATRRVPSLVLPRPRRSGWSLLLAILLHGALLGGLLFSRWQELLTWEEIVPGSTSDRREGGGGGGGGIQVVTLPAWRAPVPQVTPALPAAPVPPPEAEATPEPEPTPPVAATDSVEADSAQAGRTPGLGGTGTGGGLGSGTGTGRGSGSGPGSGTGSGGGTAGAGSGAMPPEPRQLILPPLDYPEGLRGRSIAVTFWVNTDGRVERVALEPEIEDRGFQRKFVSVMRSYRFRPARSAEGSPIPGKTTITITF